MMKRRIAQVVRRFAFEEWGGTETVVWNSSLALMKRGVEPEILATRACSAADDETRDGIAIRRFPYFYPNFPLPAKNRTALDKKGGNPVSFPLRRYLAEERFSLYHIHTAGRVAQFVREAALRAKRPYIVSFHGGCFDVPFAELSAMLLPTRHTFHYGAFLDRFFGWRADFIKDASGIICVGANELPEFRKRYPGKNIVHLPNGVDPELYRREVSIDVRERFGIPRGDRLLLCVSRIDYQKNQKQLAKLVRALADRGESAHLLLIGPVSAPDYYRELLADADALGVGKSMTVVPGLPAGDELMRAAYRQADVFLLPSRHEPFGIVVLEAWSAGLPVVAASVGGLKFLVEDGENGLLCPPDDTGSYLAALDRLKEPAFRERLIRGASAAVMEYSWDRIGARLADFYEEVLSSC